MRILAIETTEMVGSLAASDGENLLHEMDLEPSSRTAQSLAPGLQALLEQVGWKPRDVELVAVTIGPGSFTGLRIGVTTAKAFAYAVGAEILGIDTLQTIAAGVPADVAAVSVAVDAQRGEVVAGSFQRGGDGQFEPVVDAQLLPIDQWLGGLTPGTHVAGPILRKCVDSVPEGVEVLDPRYWVPKAATVARLAHRDHSAGRRDDVWQLVPNYSRRSAAEEKWAQKGR